MARTSRKGFRFDSTLDDDILSRLEQWERGVFEQASTFRTDLASQLRYRSTVPLELLPVKARRQAMDKFREIMGFDSIIRRSANNTMRGTAKEVANRVINSPYWTSHRTGDRAYGSFNVSPSDRSVKGYILNQLNVQYRTPYDGRMGAADYFAFGSESIPTTSSIRNGRQGLRRMAPGKTFTVFDLETGGLSFGQIRELSYASGRIGETGSLQVGRQTTQHMRSSSFARGMLAHNGRMLGMEDFMSSKYGVNYAGMAFGDGEAFLAKTLPFLQQVMDSDYILGHNISKFDIQQMFVGLSGTSAYKNSKTVNGINVREFVDKAYKHLDGRIVDTHVMAKQAKNLNSIITAPELARMGSSEKYSIANIILQTDLLQRAPELESLIDNGAGLHLGHVDAAVTARLAELIPSLRVVSNASMGTAAFRQGVARSAAILPITKIRNASEIGDDLLRHMILDPGSGIQTISLKLDKLLTSVRKTSGKRSSVETVLKAIRSGKHEVSFDITPLEQEIFYTRDLDIASPLVDHDTRLLGVGSFDRLTGRNTPYSGVEKGKFGRMKRTPASVSHAQYAAWQETARASGLPYAGLSFEERRLGTSLASITSTLAQGSRKQLASALGVDSLISHFNNYTSIYNNIKNPNVRLGLPAELVRHIDDSYDGMVSFSPFKYVNEATGNDVYGLNVVHQFKDQETASRAADKLEALAQRPEKEIAEALGHTPGTPEAKAAVKQFYEQYQNVAERLRKFGNKGTVSIAQIRDSKVAKRFYDVMGDFLGVSNLDDATLSVRAPIIDLQDNVLRVGAPVVNRFMGPEQMAHLAARTEEARRYLDEFIPSIMRSPRDVATAKQILNAANDVGVKKILSVNEKYLELRPKMKRAAGIAGLAMIGYYLNKKRKENNVLEEPMEFMPYEQGSSYSLQDQVQLRQMNGERGAKRMDPLATAPLVGSLYDNRINHTNMSWDKNSALYGGVI